MILLSEAQRGVGRGDLLISLLDGGGLQNQLGIDGADLALRGFPIGDRLAQRGLEILVVDACEHLAQPNRLVVGDQHLADVTGDTRRDQRVVGLDIRVVGGDQEPAVLPVVRAVMRRGGQAQHADSTEQCPLQQPLATRGAAGPDANARHTAIHDPVDRHCFFHVHAPLPTR